MTISRRQWIVRASALSVSTTLGCTGDNDASTPSLPVYVFDGPPGADGLFAHGVASGDPLCDAVILWTRVSTTNKDIAEAFYEVALDTEFEARVAAGYVTASVDHDFTIKLDVGGLNPATTYYYRFFCEGRQSTIGRTRTTPIGSVQRLRLGVCSCSNYTAGYFHGYRHLAARADLDAVLHLGDYIYEYANANVRAVEPTRELVALEDYRTRYAHYRTDADLQAMHQQHPVISIWDDHEVANNAWSGGALNHSEDEGDWMTRRAAAEQAYREWMPIRDQVPGVIYRAFAFGDLMSLFMLDTRIVGRDEQAPSFEDVDVVEDPKRQLLGADQEKWFEQTLRASKAAWNVVGQQVMMAPLRIDGATPTNKDQWNGYPAARARFFDITEALAANNLVVLTGDVHSSWAFELARDPYNQYDPTTGSGAVGVEFVTPGITSPGAQGAQANLANALPLLNPHLRWLEVTQRGYILLDITPARVQGAWYHLDDVENPEAGRQSVGAVWAVYSGSNRLTQESAPAEPVLDAPPPAPDPLG